MIVDSSIHNISDECTRGPAKQQMLIVELTAQGRDISYYNQAMESLWRGHNAKRLTEYKQDAKLTTLRHLPTELACS